MRDPDDDPADFRALDGNTIGDGPAPATRRSRFGRGEPAEPAPPQRRFRHDHKPNNGCPTCGAPDGTWYRDQDHRRRVPVEEDPFAVDRKAAPPVIGL